MNRVWKGLALALSFGLCTSFALAQSYPAKPIRTVVPYPAGGYYDVMGRQIGQKLSRALGQPVVVENRAGANGIIGTEYTAKSAPDGYTIMVGGIGPHGINPSLYKQLPYDVVRDFAPIVQIANQPNILVVNSASRFRSVQDIVAAARANPGHVTYASNGAGSSQHLSAALFALTMGLQLTHVPYKGAGPATTAMLAGEADHLFGGPVDMMSHIKSGRFRPLAVTSTKRLPAFPHLPTMAEAGVPHYEISTWFGYFAPAGTPAEIVDRLNAEINKALQEPDTRTVLEAQGSVELVGGSKEKFGEFVKAEIAKWAKVVKESGATVE
jgi:tripartite-type tricarboxylate transporter receptor subunit TctC